MIRLRWSVRACCRYCEVEATCGNPVRSETRPFRPAGLYLEWFEPVNELETLSKLYLGPKITGPIRRDELWLKINVLTWDL